MLHDHTREMEEVADVMTRKATEAYQLLADSPAQVLSTGDNLDERTFSPRLFERYGDNSTITEACKQQLVNKGVKISY